MSLARLLDDQQERLARLKVLLEEELQALTHGEIDGRRFERIAGDKQALLGELEHFERRRRLVQAKLGYPAGLEGDRRAAQDADCLETWQSLHLLAERTARLNDLAGGLLAMRMEHNQRMLAFIHDVSEKTLYDPRGRTGSQSGRLSASA